MRLPCVTRGGNRLLPYAILLLAVACASALGIAAAQDGLFGAKESTTVTREKDLLTDITGVSIGELKWSVDSRRIAYVKWNLGQIGIVDVETGKTTSIPDFYLSGISALAWSDDGNFLAVASADELRIIRLSDFRTTHVVYLKGNDALTSLRFGHVMAFSRDGMKLIFENKNDGAPVILATYDLASEAIEPMVRSPYGARRAFMFPASGRIQWHAGHLYYSALIMRYDEGKRQSKVIGNVDYGRSWRPSTCFVFDLGDGSTPVATRSLDFPPPGQETDDGSKDIKFCLYSGAADAVVVRRQNPLNFDEEAPPFPKSQLTFFESFRLGDFSSLGRYPSIGEEQKLAGPYYGLHPVRPWAITLTASPEHKPLLTVWNITSGKEISHEQLSDVFPTAEISPDGSRMAFVPASVNPQIRIYKFNIH
jgi:WD40 repeat protein